MTWPRPASAPCLQPFPGLSAPPPFGSNARTIVFNIDPDKLRSFDLTPDEVVDALAKYNVMSPSGNLRIGDIMYLTTMNSLVKNSANFGNIPIITKNGVPVYIKDIARVSDAADITVDYALINGKRSVYIPVVKTASASTWSVVQGLKSKLPEMQNLLPDDVKISYEFDQSVFVINAVKSLLTEGGLGALLTGLMVLLVPARLAKQLDRSDHHPGIDLDRGAVTQPFWANHQYHDLKRAGTGNRYPG
jgi:multidrug efflux pump subunit AcrB